MVLLLLSGLFCLGFVCCVVFVACFIVLLGLCGFVLLPFGFDLYWILFVCVVPVSFLLLCLSDCVCDVAYFVYVSGFVLCSLLLFVCCACLGFIGLHYLCVCVIMCCLFCFVFDYLCVLRSLCSVRVCGIAVFVVCFCFDCRIS